MIPFFQDFEPADNGFVPMWEIAQQTNFGIPNAYLHWFPTDIQNLQGPVNNPLIHLYLLFLNLYLLGLITILVLFVNRKIIEKRKRTDNKG